MQNWRWISAVDDELTRYEVDVEGASLVRRETIKVLANVQYAWPYPPANIIRRNK